jgi:acyl carrier protein
MNDLEKELKVLIIDALDLEDMTPEDIESDAPLFGDGLGLDSIDALELGVRLQQKYNVKLNAETKDVQKHFSSINSLKSFIESNSTTEGEK